MEETNNEFVMIHNDDKNSKPIRKIRSFVQRAGRITDKQNKALEQHWDTFGIDYNPELKLNFAKIFGNTNPVILEIGFGTGISLLHMAKTQPNLNYLGIEVYASGVGNMLHEINLNKLTNIRVMSHDAVEVLENMIVDSSLAGLQLYFPDPWHKSKHHKRRIVQDNFIKLVNTKLCATGFIHMATDWDNYAEHMLEVLNNNADLVNTSLTNDFIERPEQRIITKFETRGIKLGHNISDIMFKKKS